MSKKTPYTELQVTSNYSFLRGASHPYELAEQARCLAHKAIAITDRNTLAGVVRMHTACKNSNIRLIVGVRIDLKNKNPSLLCFPTNRAAYGRLSQLLSLGKKRAKKGKCFLFLEDLLEEKNFKSGKEQVIIIIPPDNIDNTFQKTLIEIRNKIKNDLYLSVNYRYNGNDKKRYIRI